MPRRVALGVLVAPLAGPLAVFVGLVVRSLLAPPVHEQSFSIPAMLVLLMALYIFGAPLGYAAMLILAWPLTRAAAAARGSSWWISCAAGALTGAAIFPVYLHLLDRRGSFDFFPGAGVLAGGAVAGVFWLLAIRRAGTSNR